MSDLPGHDHDPDPAALDELRRAFGDEATRPTEPNPLVRRGDRTGNDRSVGDADDASAATTDTSGEPVRSAELAALARGVADHEPTPPGLSDEPVDDGDTDEPEHDESDHDEPVDDADTDEPEHDEPDHDEPVDDADTDEPDRDEPDHDEPVDDGDTDEPDRDEPDHDEPVVDHDPTPEAEPASMPETPAPTIIRIDDYGGSTAIDPDERGPVVDPDTLPADEPSGGGVISISVDDDLPDPVYVEGSLDRDGGGTIVFIENDETGDTLAPESERDMRRGIEPRMRERRVAVKRAQGRRRLKRALLILGIVVLIVGGLAVLGSPLFAVREGNVEITGAVYSRGDEFDAVVEDAVGTPVLRVDTTRIEEDLEAIPWIEQAQVTTQFPYGLTIDVRERAAVSTYQGPDGRFRVLDRDGRVLDVIEDGYPYAYVLIGGPDAVDLEPGEFAPQGYAAASELAKNLTSSVRGNVVRIDVVSDGSRLTLELDDGSTVFFGEARDILAKLVRLEAVFANGEDREPGLIDVSTSDVTR